MQRVWLLNDSDRHAFRSCGIAPGGSTASPPFHAGFHRRARMQRIRVQTAVGHEIVENHRTPWKRFHAQFRHRKFGRAARVHRIQINADGTDAVAGMRAVHLQGARRQVIAMRSILLARQIAQHGQLFCIGQIDAGGSGHAQLRHAQRGVFQQRVEARLAARAHLQGMGHAGERIGGLRVVQMRLCAGDQQPAFVGGEETVDHRDARLRAQGPHRWRRQCVLDRELTRRGVVIHRRRQREVG